MKKHIHRSLSKLFDKIYTFKYLFNFSKGMINRHKKQNKNNIHENLCSFKNQKTHFQIFFSNCFNIFTKKQEISFFDHIYSP